MNHIMLLLFSISLLAVLIEVSIFLLPIERKNKGLCTRRNVLITSLCFIIVFFVTFIPHKIMNLGDHVITHIEIKDGSTGKQFVLSEPEKIEFIVENIANTKFQKTRSSLFQMGYGYDLTFYDSKGKSAKRIIVNSSRLVRYKGYFYETKNDSIDFKYITELMQENAVE